MASFTWGDSSAATWGEPDPATWGISEPAAPEDLEVNVVGDREISLEWTTIGAPDEIRIDRALDEDGAPGDWSEIAAIAATESYTDDDASLLDAERYWYRVTSVNAIGESDSSSEVRSDRLPLPPVEDLAVDAVDGRRATLSWTDPSNNTDHYQALLREASEGDDYEQDGSDIDAVDEGETQTYETTELLDGEQYDATVETYAGEISVRESES